jgi:hypothetical protein
MARLVNEPTSRQRQCSPGAFFVHDSPTRKYVLALGERGSALTLGKNGFRRIHGRSAVDRDNGARHHLVLRESSPRDLVEGSARELQGSPGASRELGARFSLLNSHALVLVCLSVFLLEKNAEQGARTNVRDCHASCKATSRAKQARGSSVTLDEEIVVQPFDRNVIFGAAALFALGAGVVLREVLLDDVAHTNASTKGIRSRVSRHRNAADIRAAAVTVLSNWCGNSFEDASFREQARILNEAGPAIVPMLTEMVADRSMSDWFVGNACYQAARHPFSDGFRDAVRSRRDGPGVCLHAMFAYFGQFGDESDLRWLESKQRVGNPYFRKEAEKAADRLRLRLSNG